MGGIDTEEYVVLFLVVFLLICGQWSCGLQPNYTTRHGVQVYDQTKTQTTDRADIEYITAVALELWPTDLGRAVLRLRDEPIDLSLYYGGDRHIAAGTFAEGTMTVWSTQYPCFARTAYGHELLHLMYWVRNGWKEYGTHEELRELNVELQRRAVGGLCNDD
jgi:hypothetical protein